VTLIQLIGNVLSFILSTGCLVVSIMIYRMIKAKPIFWLIVASSMGLALRILLNVETYCSIDVYDTSYVAVFYIFLFIAYVMMYRIFRKYLS
jgi:hypothetical protein